MLAALARGLHLTLDERDHLFRLGGHAVPQRVLRDDHISPGMMRILDRLDGHPGHGRLAVSARRCCRPGRRSPCSATRPGSPAWPAAGLPLVHRPGVPADLSRRGPPDARRIFTAQLRDGLRRRAPGGPAGEIVDALLAASPEFAEVWAEHEVGASATSTRKRIAAPRSSASSSCYCQTLHDPDQSQALLVFTAVPGSPSYEKLQLLAAVGD